MEQRQGSSIRKLAWVAAIVVLFVILTGVLMSSLSSSKLASQTLVSKRQFRSDYGRVEMLAGYADEDNTLGSASKPPARQAQVRKFIVDVDLTPKLSVGTDRPESIYEAKFTAKITAVRPGGHAGDSAIRLPLPPQLISLADLSVTVNGDPSDSVGIEDGQLVWVGHLDENAPGAIEITYTAMGQGIFTLAPPAGRIVDEFTVTIAANGSDVRILELSLQPETPIGGTNRTTYVWKYSRLMFGRPIMLDVLGIAPEDKLGELVWLGPVSVLVFGLLVGMAALAFRPEQLDAWMLLLLVGAFAGGYPLMYFAQDFLPLGTSIILSAAVVLAIIGVRGVTLLGPVVGMSSVVVLGAAVQAVTLAATVWPHLQGVLLTILGLGTLVVALTLLPRVRLQCPAPEPAATEGE